MHLMLAQLLIAEHHTALGKSLPPDSLGWLFFVRFDSPQYPRRIASHNSTVWNIFCDDAPCTNNRPLADCHPAQNGRTRTNGSPALDLGGITCPICLGLKFSIGIGGSWKAIIDESNSVPDENLILNRHTFAYKSVTGDLTTRTNPGTFLNLNKGSNLGIISNDAPVKICEGKNLDPLAKLHIRGNALIKLVWNTHAANTLLPPADAATPLG